MQRLYPPTHTHPSIGIGSPSFSLGMSPSLGNPKTALTLRVSQPPRPALQGLLGPRLSVGGEVPVND